MLPSAARSVSAQTVGDVLDWYDTHERGGSLVAVKERRRLRQLFKDRFGSLPLNKRCAAELLDFIAAQPGVRSDWTRRRIKAAINRPFNYAAELGLITRNPFRGLRIPEGQEGRDWTDAEYQAVLRASPPYFRRLVVFLRFGGARPGEARTVTWPQVQTQAAAIVLREHKTAFVVHEARRIHFNHVLAALLRWLWRNRTHSSCVFTNKFGRPWTITALAKHLRTLRRRVGLAEDVKMHGGRHMFATQALLNGVDPKSLSELLGHRSLKSTERYLHLANKRAHLNAAMEQAITHRNGRGDVGLPRPGTTP